MKLIVAYQGKDRGIGYDNSIPWHLKEDLQMFKEKTSLPSSVCKSIVIMGRKTWESIPVKFRPLSNRINYVVSNNNSLEFKQSIEQYQDSLVVNDLDKLLVQLDNTPNINVWIIGGSMIYNKALSSGLVTEIHVTEIYSDPSKKQTYECSVFFPEIHSSNYSIANTSSIQKSICKQSNNPIYYRYITYKRNDIFGCDTSYVNLNNSSINLWKSNEQQYLDILREILEEGQETIDRTGVGTLSVFGRQFKYDLSEGLPVLTTKRIFLRAVFEELMLYLSGKTDNKILQEKKIHIWDGNTSREFLDSRGLNSYPEGDMGETYGYNFRNFGGDYENCDVGVSKQDGFDQLEYAINLIRNDPHSRRIIINLWNPKTLHKAALPSCLCQYQFYVNTKKKTLDLQIYIRSSDFFLANNWNTCTGAFFVYMICNLEDIDLSPGILTVVTGDTHIYKTHIEGVKENLLRKPRPQPIIEFNEKKTKLEDYSWEDFNIIGYLPQKNIKAEMAV